MNESTHPILAKNPPQGRPPISTDLGQTKHHSPWENAIYRFTRNKLSLVSFFIVLFLILMTLFAPYITPYPFDKPDYEAVGKGPSWAHWMGTDIIGRDLFSRIIYGSRVSISVGLLVQLVALLVGLPLGCLAGYYGGRIDYVIMRCVDALMAFPQMLIVMLIMIVLGPGLGNVLIALGLVSWLPICRLMRAQGLSLREQEFITAAKSLGATDLRIMSKHFLPNALSPIIVATTLGIPMAIFAEAGLSFIGIGITPPMPSWGQMVGEYYKTIQAYWHLPFFPAIMLGLTMLSFTLLGDGLQEALNPSGKS